MKASVVGAGSLRAAVRVELAHARHPPFEVPAVVVVNGILMTAAWFLLPPTLLSLRFGALAFPLMLASWMYSDVPATNVLGSDVRRTVPALNDPSMLRRLLYAKNLALWLLVTPIGVAVALGVGVHEHRPIATAFSLVWIAAVPLGALGVAAWFGIYFPYHQLALAYRWRHRRRWRTMIVRWLILILTPYLLVPALTLPIIAPTLLLWWLLTPDGEGFGGLSDGSFAVGAVLACAVAMSVWIGGHHNGARIARRRQDKLVAFLNDPDRG